MRAVSPPGAEGLGLGEGLTDMEEKETKDVCPASSLFRFYGKRGETLSYKWQLQRMGVGEKPQ